MNVSTAILSVFLAQQLTPMVLSSITWKLTAMVCLVDHMIHRKNLPVLYALYNHCNIVIDTGLYCDSKRNSPSLHNLSVCDYTTDYLYTS